MKKCPVCKSTEGVRLYLYGMPSEEPDPKKFVIGGCLVFEDMPDYKCISCSTDFYKNSDKYQNRFISDGSGINFKCPARDRHDTKGLAGAKFTGRARFQNRDHVSRL